MYVTLKRLLGKQGMINFDILKCGLSIFSRMSRIEPIAFRIGDIVEVQFSMLLVPINNRRYKTTLKLRGLAVLNTKFTDVSSQC